MVARTVLAGAMVAGSFAMPAYGQSVCTMGRSGFYYGNDDAAAAAVAGAVLGLALGMLAESSNRHYNTPRQTYYPETGYDDGSLSYGGRGTNYAYVDGTDTRSTSYGHSRSETRHAATTGRTGPNAADFVGDGSHQLRCKQQYDSYDPYTDTFLARDGQRYFCEL